MKKHLANIISLSRVAGAIALFFFNDISTAFLIIYVLCGITDLIDGPIARKTNSTSPLGATLDTVGDVATYLALTKVLIIKKLVAGWILAWILSAGVLFGVGALISKRRFGKLYLPHTYLGKIFGGAVFVLPLAMQFMPGYVWMSVICSIATVHAFELLYVQSKNKTAEDFVPSALHVNK
ncbi:MAG: CDP-alcohol phosphatidyltransferase family protein [Clostridia bacterium]|nr:CDP-alcohol phosphatidyltransferase family protein [Clostridia bacterium]